MNQVLLHHRHERDRVLREGVRVRDAGQLAQRDRVDLGQRPLHRQPLLEAAHL